MTTGAQVIVASGLLRNLVTIEVSTDTQDAQGGMTPSWSTFATTYAEIEPMSGKEFIAAQQMQSEQLQTITIRYVAGVIPTMRVNFNGTIYNIKAVLNIDTRNRVLQLMCDTGLNQG